MADFLYPAAFPVSGSFNPDLRTEASFKLALTVWLRCTDKAVYIKLVEDLLGEDSSFGYGVFQRTSITRGPFVAFRLVGLCKELPEGLSPSTSRRLFGCLDPQQIPVLFSQCLSNHG